jgi:hypothetical protein
MQHYESGFEEVTLQRAQDFARKRQLVIMVTMIIPTFERVHAQQGILYGYQPE